MQLHFRLNFEKATCIQKCDSCYAVPLLGVDGSTWPEYWIIWIGIGTGIGIGEWIRIDIAHLIFKLH